MSKKTTDTTPITTTPITEAPMYGQRHEFISLTRNLFKLLHPEAQATGTARQYAVVWGITDALNPTEQHIEAAREYEAGRAKRAAEAGRSVLTGEKLEQKIQRVADWGALHEAVCELLDQEALTGPVDNVGNPIILADGPSISKADRLSRKVVKDSLKAHIRFRKRGMQTWGDVPNALKARMLFETAGLDPERFDYSKCGDDAAPVQSGFVPSQPQVQRQAVAMVTQTQAPVETAAPAAAPSDLAARVQGLKALGFSEAAILDAILRNGVA